MHRLLQRQLRKHVGSDADLPDKVQRLLAAIDAAYHDNDSDRQMLERSLELSSNEMRNLNHGLREQKAEVERSLKQIQQMQEQLTIREKMASLGELTAGIAHELKNPLNFIANFAEVSLELVGELQPSNPLEQLNEEEQRDQLDMIADNLARVVAHAQRADGIIKAMLGHARSGPGQFAAADINALVEESLSLACQAMRANVPNFALTVERAFSQDLPTIAVQAQELRQVFINLFKNACDATLDKQRQQGPDYQARLHASTEHRGDWVLVRIRDNGTGIPKTLQDKVFTPFFTTKPVGVGTGLGLSLSYDIVVGLHGGKLELESSQNEFTEFVVSLPLRR